MAKIKIQGEIVIAYLDEFIDIPTHTLAKKIYIENPEAFKSIETCRSVIRYYRGASGKANAKKSGAQKYKRKKGEPFGWNRLPDGEKEIDWLSPAIINCKLALVLSDIHFPWHNKVALMAALEHGFNKGVDVIYLNGDIMDAYQLSRYVNDPRLRNFKEELDLCRDFLYILRSEFPDARIYFKIGNHEIRYEKYMMLKSPQFLDIPYFSLEHILHFDDLDIQMIESHEWANINGLPVLHGHEAGGSFYNPVNPARSVFLKMTHSAIIGHHHQSSSHSSKNMLDEIIQCWSTGCLCDLHPKYLAVNKWNIGFAEIEGVEEGYLVHNYRIHNKRIMNV